MASKPNVSLREIYVDALKDATKASKKATIEDETQQLVASALDNLHRLSKAIEISGIFSPNETLEDLPTPHLPYLLVGYATAELEGRVKSLDSEERMRIITASQRHLQAFLQRLRQYEIIPEEERKAFSQSASLVKDAVSRRELKIKQYKMEKALRNRLEIIHNRRGQVSQSDGSDDNFDLILNMLPSGPKSDEHEDEEDEDALRESYLLAIRLIWVQAQTQSESMEQELKLLQNAPPSLPPSSQGSEQQDDMWRLDPSIPKGGSDGRGPLMDSSGRVLRPFTILPGMGSSERARLQAEVFRSDHRLPTMTMDEYLEEEKRRGKIITGGGPQSESKLTRSEQVQLDSELDGTLQGEEKGEEKRQEDERWAQYTDLHPKGEGNTMNRG